MKNDWMSKVDGDRSLADLLIPGTHDSGTCKVYEDPGVVGRFIEDRIGKKLLELSEQIENRVREEVEAVLGKGAGKAVPHKMMKALTQVISAAVGVLLHAPARREIANLMARCQYEHMDIRRQLENGIRFLDVRCHASSGNSSMQLRHGPFKCNLTLAEVIEECVHFLQRNTKETVIMMIKQEQSEAKDIEFAKNVLRHVNKRGDYVHLGPGVPRLKDVRGKIFLVNRFLEPTDDWLPSKKLGFDATQWDDNKIFTKRNFQGNDYAVQDRYEF